MKVLGYDNTDFHDKKLVLSSGKNIFHEDFMYKYYLFSKDVYVIRVTY